MVLYRYLQIAYYYSSMNGLQRAKFTHPNVNYRYIVAPTVSLPFDYIPLSLNATEVNSIYDQGVIDGEHAIKNKITIEDHLEYFEMKTKGDKKIALPTFKEFVESKRAAQKKDEKFLENTN